MRRAQICIVLVALTGCAVGSEIDPSESASATSGGGGSPGSGGAGTAGGGTGGDSTCTPGETESCSGGEAGRSGIGQCTDGVRACEWDGEFAVWGQCTGWVGPAPESCNGVDDDCDGETDEDCCVPEPESCDGEDDDCDGLIDEDDACDIGSSCKLHFPPPATIPCDVPDSGQPKYVSAVTGDDANTGDSPDQPWASLAFAIASAPPGATLRVAGGDYGAADVAVTKGITVKGGWDVAFTTWDPDSHASLFSGRLTLDHEDAVWGGFRMRSKPIVQGPPTYHWHRIASGTLVRNYVEMLVTASADSSFFYGIAAATDVGETTRIACNDVYFRETGPNLWSTTAVEYGQVAALAGTAILDSNRVCHDGGAGDHPRYPVAGMGPCAPVTASIAITNNVLESAHTGNWAFGVELYGCGAGDLQAVLTNNTILARKRGITGYGTTPPAGSVLWKLTNNVVVGTGDTGTAIDVFVSEGLDMGPVQILTSESNLTFGWADNGMYPQPLLSAGNDTSGSATLDTVFVGAQSGDLHLQPGGAATGTGLNVHGVPAYGNVTVDLDQLQRPVAGPWNRGALGP